MAEEAPRDWGERIAERVEVPDRDDQHQADAHDDYRPVDPFKPFKGGQRPPKKEPQIISDERRKKTQATRSRIAVGRSQRSRRRSRPPAVAARVPFACS